MMKNTTIKTLTSTTLVAVLSMVAIPMFTTPVFAEGDLTCEVKTHEDGSTYTECDGSGQITNEQIQQTVQQAQQTWEQETGYTYGVNINEQTPAPVHNCQDDGYSADYYWSESAGACVTDYVEPTPVPSTGGLTCEVKIHETGSTYIECTNTGAYIADPTTNEDFQETVKQTQQAWEQETGYTYGVNINDQTPKPTTTPTAKPVTTPKPTVNPTSTPTSTPSSTPTSSMWNYTKVSTALLTLINNQRIANGVKPLSVVETAVADATQRAMESMEYSKTVTAYGTSTDGHYGFDTEWGDNEALGFESRLTGSESEEDIAKEIFESLTTGVTKNDAVFSARYSNTAFGFTDAFFTRRNGNVLGYNVYYSLLLGK